MLRITRKQLGVLVALAIFPFDADLSFANPVDTKEKKPESISKPGELKSKPAGSNRKPVISESTDTIADDDGDRNGRRRRTAAHGMHNQRYREKRGGHRKGDGIPSFRNVKNLESLTVVQQAKISRIIRTQREQSLPLMERLRELREVAHSPDIAASVRPKKSPESAELRKKIHAIKRDAWLQMQRILTTRQKIELEAHREDESGPPKRYNPDARPTVHDSGKSFSH